MARICEICAKKPKKAASRSHSNIKTLRRQYVNIQKVAGRVMCARCLKTEQKAKLPPT